MPSILEHVLSFGHMLQILEHGMRRVRFAFYSLLQRTAIKRIKGEDTMYVVTNVVRAIRAHHTSRSQEKAEERAEGHAEAHNRRRCQGMWLGLRLFINSRRMKGVRRHGR